MQTRTAPCECARIDGDNDGGQEKVRVQLLFLLLSYSSTGFRSHQSRKSSPPYNTLSCHAAKEEAKARN